jgi:hypothetical protein
LPNQPQQTDSKGFQNSKSQSSLGDNLMEENSKAEEQNNSDYKENKNIGLAVFLLLIALTIGEFFIGSIAIDWNWPLWSISIFKAALIIFYFMHVTRVFGKSEEESS